MVSKSLIIAFLPLLLMVSLVTTQDSEISENTCKCDWFGTNCKISVPASENMACKCTAPKAIGIFPTTCTGEEVECANPGNKYCKHPDTSFLSCLQGQGDCYGYERKTTHNQQGCECGFRKPNGIWAAGGCIITNRSPANFACRCQYTFYTCYGYVELCQDETNPKCKNPDDGPLSCKEGGGDCNGYQKTA